MRNVSKEIFLKARVCPALGWLMRAGELKEKPTLAEQFRMDQGKEIGARARKLYPEGKLVEYTDTVSAAEQTVSLMNDPDISIILEATFVIDGFAAKADILKRESDGWHMLEVKSSVKDKGEFIDDMAYTTMIIERSGYNVSDVSLMLISKDYRLGMEAQKLFVEKIHTEDVKNRIDEFEPFWKKIEEITSQNEKPEPKLIFECKKCELFSDCVGKDIENHIFEIPWLRQSKFDKLRERNFVTIDKIPDDFDLTEKQLEVRNSVIRKKPFISENLKNALESITWPAYYLDFETMAPAIPLYPGIAPYEQISTQYSIHKYSDLGKFEEHFEYLAEPDRDCREELAKQLLEDLNTKGSIIVYTDFEQKRINYLSKQFAELSEQLLELIDRLVDIADIIKKNFYMPEFHGSFSIKKVLPALLPESKSYDSLKISDGLTAMSLFAMMAQGKHSEKEMLKIRENLLEYCKQDTLAMVNLHERLMGYV